MLKLQSDLKEKIETLVIPVCEDKDIHENRDIVSVIEKAKTVKNFKGEKDQDVIFYDDPSLNAERVIVMGLGKAEKTDTEALRACAGNSVKKCIAKEPAEVLIALPSETKLGKDTADMLEAMMEGALLANHLFDKYKSEKKQIPLKQIAFLIPRDAVKKFAKLGPRVSLICEGTILAREWVSLPSGEKTPAQLAGMISELAEKEKLDVRVFDEKELKEKGCGAILAVGAGSDSPPRMAVLAYKAKNAKKTVAFVGKGITFDSGGINMKPGGSSRNMKNDMAGAAAVAATLITVARLKPKINVIGVAPLVENMPSGKAYRPGDILKTFEGKTVEVGNTDAEGRLILIDALSYAVKTYKPDVIIDLATLTGACLTALGDKIAGLFSSDDALAEAIMASGQKTFERCWRLPLPEDYKESLKSEIADKSNVADMNGAGAVTAALFLSEFVGETRWAHLDIAGPAFFSKGSAYCGAGGTGFGVRLLCDLLEKL